MEVKAILEENKKVFEDTLTEYLNQGYKIQSSNFTAFKYLEKDFLKRVDNAFKLKNLDNYTIKVVFYALLIKE